MARSITAAASNTSRNRGILLLAAVFGILSAVLMFAFLTTRGGNEEDIESALTADTASETVVVLTRNVAAGEKITADMVTTKSVPVSALLEGRVTDVNSVVGKVATAPLFAGEQVISQKVTAFEGENTLAYKVPEGRRALSLMVPHEAWNAGGLVQPGDRVDVLGVTTFVKVDPLTGEERPDLLAGYIAQDVLVLAVSQTLVKIVPNLENRDSGGGSLEYSAIAGDSGETFQEAISVTLALTPEEAAKVAIIDAMKDDQGQYRILVRQTGDSDLLTGNREWSYEDLFNSTVSATDD